MKNKKFILALIAVGVLTLLVVIGVGKLSTYQKQIAANAVTLGTVSQTISATGSIHSQNEVTLHFQTGGKVIYLPFKQGDTVTQGQTIAQLDTFPLQKALQIQANTYEIAKNNNTQTQEYSQAGIIAGQQRVVLDTSNKDGYAGTTEVGVIADNVQRIVDSSLASQNIAQLNVDLANYAVQLASLTAPFSGVLTQEDITTPNVNVTPLTSFSLADPSAKVFRANVAVSDIDFVSVGAKATVKLDGKNTVLQGIVSKIYPQKQTLPSGEDVYQVDIIINNLSAGIAFGQNGSVLIQSNTQTEALLVPSWAIVGHTSVWVVDNNHVLLKAIQVGKVHGSLTEVAGGLLKTDKVIMHPEDIAKLHYQLL